MLHQVNKSERCRFPFVFFSANSTYYFINTIQFFEKKNIDMYILVFILPFLEIK